MNKPGLTVSSLLPPSRRQVLDLSYYTDESKLKKKGSVDLTKFVSIKPSVTVGGRDNLFALEIQGRTYIMQAANSTSKNVWLAKLYESLSGGEDMC